MQYAEVLHRRLLAAPSPARLFQVDEPGDEAAIRLLLDEDVLGIGATVLEAMRMHLAHGGGHAVEQPLPCRAIHVSRDQALRIAQRTVTLQRLQHQQCLLPVLLLVLPVEQQAGGRDVVSVEQLDIAIFAFEGRTQAEEMPPAAVDMVFLTLDENRRLTGVIQGQHGLADAAPAAATIVGLLEPVVLLQSPECGKTVGMILPQRPAPGCADVLHRRHAHHPSCLRNT